VAAARHLELINSGVECQAVVCDVSPGNIENLIAEADVVLDGTDNFDIKFIINDTCVKLGVPWVYGGVVGASGMTMTIIPGETPCLACVFGDGGYGGGLTCDTVGVIGPAVHVIASIQAAEALKILVGDTGHLRRGLLTVDLWENEWHTIAVSEKDPNCKVCGTREFPHLRAESALQTAFLCGRDAVQVSPPKGQQVDLEALSQKLQRVAEVTRNAFLLKAIIDGREIVVFPDGRAMIKGTKDETLARSIYAKYVGH
jgi:adenylyltransferase/sulfurtransferase